MRFVSSNTAIATVNPPSDSTSPFATIVTAVAPGTATVPVTAVLSDGRTLTGAADVNVSVPAPTPPPCPFGTRARTVTLPQTSSLAVSYEEIVTPSSNCGRGTWRYSASSIENNIPLNHSIAQPAPGFDWCPATYKGTTREAVFNFSGLNIPKGAEIKKATLFSSSSDQCQASRVTGSANNVSPFSSSGFGTFFAGNPVPFLSFPFDSSRFGSGAMSLSSQSFGCPFPGIERYCGRCSGRVEICGNSANPSGAGDVISIIRNIVSSQDLTQVAFKLRPEFSDRRCSASRELFTFFTANFSVNSPGPASLTINYCEPISSFSIAGAIFTDTNADFKKNPSESNYLGPVNISITNGLANFAVSNNNGSYSSNNLPQGQYTIIFSGLPQGSVFTYPSTPLIVNIGSSCSFPITSEARCASGSISSLNAGVTNTADAWFQSIGSDMRWDSGFSNIIPQNKFASILGTGGMPGIIFSGKTTASFGQGQASQSPFNWVVGSFSDPEVFTDTHNLIPTSYRFLLETVDASAIAKKTVAELCSGGSAANCTVTANLSNGVYAINGDLNLNGSGYTFPSNKDFVILINGNLNINEEIHIPIGSTAIFSAKGNITVNKNIGETQSSTAPTIEGLYSADSNFVAEGNRNCALAIDLRLNVAGSVIANAGRGSGTFVNNRNLCAGNSSFPSVSFIERPDFMLNYPSLVQQTTRAWQDVAP